MKKTIACPICNEGHITFEDKHNKSHIELKRSMCKTLIKEGFSYRQVAKLLGYKSVSSVQYFINKEN